MSRLTLKKNYPTHPGGHENASYIHIEKTTPSPGTLVFSTDHDHFHSSDISIKPMKITPGGHEQNVLTKCHEDLAQNASSRLFTYIEKTAPPPGGHVFPLITTIFKPVRAIHITNETNVLTKFHEDLTKNITSRVFTCFHYMHIEKTAPPTGGHVFSPIWTIFKLVRDINKTNVLTKFHDDWAKIVTSRVFTRNTAPPPGGHASNVTSTLHEDRTINMASRVFTRQNVYDGRTTHDGRRTKGDHKSSP
ncbi:hypothetical protein DPMN_184216 [Dreissena polymorpha]|uniref:Uncharacterized protein n=1 Tax=Dreissena polymorpha TaxID=45954 RepID=A0A9D4I666_DREPO|nr:hypothetical protein DPMN_184216 [Dreissena polymorpha]